MYNYFFYKQLICKQTSDQQLNSLGTFRVQGKQFYLKEHKFTERIRVNKNQYIFFKNKTILFWFLFL